jgi:type I restriction enzyme, S subunit
MTVRMMRLDEIGTVIQGNSPPSSTYCEADEGTPLIQGPGDFDIDEAVVKKWTTAPTRYVPRGAILISVRAGVGRVNFAPCDCTIGRGVAALITDEKYDPQYVRLAIMATSHQLEKLAIGSTITGITGKHLKSHQIPIIDYEEQVRLGEVVNHQVLVLRQMKDLTKNSGEKIQLLRISILNVAFEGKLVPTEHELALREGRDYEPANQLLERILVDRHELFEANNPGKEYKQPNKPDLTTLPLLPIGWIWTSIGELFEVKIGSTPKRKIPEYWGGGIPWVSSGEVKFTSISHTKETISSEGLANSSTQINPVGSVLLAMIGEGKTRGQTAILNIEACNNQNSAAIWVSQTLIPPQFIYYLLMKNYSELRMRGSGNNQPAMNKKIVQSIPIPLPPLAEIRRICHAVTGLLGDADSFSGILSSIEEYVGGLNDSILVKSFDFSLSEGVA